MVNVTNGTNQSSIYGSTVNGCFYAAKDGVEEGLDGRKRFMLIVNVCSFFMLIHLIITHLYTYKKNKRYKRKYEDLSMFQKIFVCFVKVDDLPDRKFGFPVNMVTHAVLLNFPTTLSMILVLLIAPFRKTICELPVLCAISGVSVYWTSLSTCSIALSLAFIINRVVLDKKLQLDRNALKTCQKKYQNPALLVAYVVNFILAFLCIAPFKFGPMYLYCGTHKSLKGRLFYYVPFLLYGVITLIFTVPVVVHFGGQILKERKKGAEDKPTSAAAKRRKKSQDQKLSVMMRITAIALLQGIATLVAGFRRFVYTIQYDSYEDLVTGLKGELGFPITEFIVSIIPWLIYIAFGPVLDMQFREVTFWRYIFGCKCKKDVEDESSVEASSSTEADSSS